MAKVYERINWEDLPSKNTPINAENLNKMDKAIDDLDDKIVELEESSGDGDYLEKENPVGTGSFSMNRKADSVVGDYSHVAGYENVASANAACAEGRGNVASAVGAHAEGSSNTASGPQAHVQGYNNTASGSRAHAGGQNSNATKSAAFAHGFYANALADYATAFGFNILSNNYGGFVAGIHNKELSAGRTIYNQIGDVFAIGNGYAVVSGTTNTAIKSNALRVTYLGEAYGLSAFNSSGADYSEFIKPWGDGNEDNEDRVGYFVTIRDGVLHKAEAGDYIAGITSGNPSVVGNGDEDYYWKYERDEFNRIVMEDVPEVIIEEDENGGIVTRETGNIVQKARMKLSENYDATLQYIPRKERKEWDYVGMLGVLPVRDDGTCKVGKFCKCGNGGIATLATERGFDTYMVIERLAENVVSVILK